MIQNANRAFRFALAGVFTCCAPLGLLAVYWGWKARTEALAKNVPVPRKANIALVLGVISVVQFTAFFIVGWQKQKVRDQAAQGASSRLKGNRTDLTGTVACDLVTEYLLGKEKKSFDAVACPKAAAVTGTLASMSDIRATGSGGVEVLKACFGHASRWFVIAADANAECPPSLPPTKAGGDPDIEEDRLRAEIRTNRLRDIVGRFDDRIDTARAAVGARVHGETACPPLDISPWASGERARVEIGYIDFELLNASPERDVNKWKFLSKSDVAQAIDSAQPLDWRSDRVTSLTKNAPALLAVFVSTQRRWPVLQVAKGIIKDDLSFAGGRFEGWLTLVDLDARAVRCETRLTFANSDRVRYLKGGSEKRSAEEALNDDFQSHFEDAAIAAIKKLGEGKLKLGVKMLE